ncbi:g3903 [Coccomyxa elongata]
MAIRVIVQHGKNTYEVHAETVDDLSAKVEEVSGIFARHQRLIHKGKVLAKGASMAEAKLKDGSKVMLMASSSTATQGQIAAQEVTKAKAAEARERARLLIDAKDRKAALMQAPASLDSSWQERAALWCKTGVASIRDAGVGQVPSQLWDVADSLRSADLGSNHLTCLPPNVALLTGLTRLRLSGNRLVSGGVPWTQLAALSQLNLLALDHNQLTEVPDAIGTLRSLQRLSLAHNSLTQLPGTLGQLTALRRLDLRHNQLQSLPGEIGGCCALEELDAAENCLDALPDSLGRLQKLRSLLLDKNRLKAVPAAVLRGCRALATLGLHGNPVTVEELRASDGFAEFNARRCAKHDKQLEMQVFTLSGGFDEGADQVQW